MAIRSLKPSELTGKHIYQQKNKTIYSDFFMKDYGYLITSDAADKYRSYSLRGFESIFGFVLLLLVSKSNIIFSFLASLCAYIVITLMFYFKFLHSLPKVENFIKEKRDGYIIATAKDMSVVRILIITIICAIFTAAIIYYPINNGYEGVFRILLFLIGGVAGIFTLMNLFSLIYKIIKRV